MSQEFVDVFKAGDEVLTMHGEGRIVGMSLQYADVNIGDEVIKCDMRNIIKKSDALLINGKVTSWDRLEKQDRTDLAMKAGINVPNTSAYWDELPERHQELIKYVPTAQAPQYRAAKPKGDKQTNQDTFRRWRQMDAAKETTRAKPKPTNTSRQAVKHVVIKDATRGGYQSYGMPKGHMARVARENPVTANNPSTRGAVQANNRRRQSDSNAQANLQVRRDYDKGNVSQRHPAIAMPKGKPNSLGPKQTTGTAVKHVVIKDTKDEKAFARQVASDNVHRGNRGYKPQASVTVQKKN